MVVSDYTEKRVGKRRAIMDPCLGPYQGAAGGLNTVEYFTLSTVII